MSNHNRQDHSQIRSTVTGQCGKESQPPRLSRESTVVSERTVEREIKVPRKVVREEIVDRVVVVPEKVMREERAG